MQGEIIFRNKDKIRQTGDTTNTTNNLQRVKGKKRERF